MKLLLLSAFILCSRALFAQDWTPEQEAVLAKYELIKEDHRGIQFVDNEQEAMVTFKTLEEAINFFLRKEIMTDLLNVYVISYPSKHQINGAILDLRESINLHLALSNTH